MLIDLPFSAFHMTFSVFKHLNLKIWCFVILNINKLTKEQIFPFNNVDNNNIFYFKTCLVAHGFCYSFSLLLCFCCFCVLPISKHILSSESIKTHASPIIKESLSHTHTKLTQLQYLVSTGQKGLGVRRVGPEKLSKKSAVSRPCARGLQ